MSTSQKRAAPDTTTPDTRPSKRAATSSPEEGELDDSTTPAPPAATTPRVSPPPAVSKIGTKVKFPFKTKSSTAMVVGTAGMGMGMTHELPPHPNPKPDMVKGPNVYERPREDEKRHRSEHHARPPYDDRDRDRDRRSRKEDHYRPHQMDSYRPRDEWRGGDRYEPLPPPPPPPPPPRDRDRDRDRSPRGRDRHHHHSYSHDHDRHRDRERDRSRDSHSHRRRPSSPSIRDDGSRTPLSRSPGNKSPSPSSRSPPSSSQRGKGKHRLPTRRAANLSPLPLPPHPRDYDRDHEYEYDYDGDKDRYHYHPRDPRDHYQRDEPEEYDRRGYGGYGYGYDGSARSRDRDRDYRDGMGVTPSFSFSSPRPQRTYSTSSQQQQQPITLPPTQPGKTPPGPPPLPLPAPTSSSSPPLTLSLSLPAPAPAAPNDPWILKDNHTTVSIKIRRPAPVPVPLPAPIPPAPHAPLENRSPPSMRLPAFPDSKQQQAKGPVPPPEQKANEWPKSELAKAGTMGAEKEKEKGRATIVKRTREEEKKAYERVFAGCGQKDDYNILTKLGEGTFGEVHKAMHKKKMSPVAIKRILMHNEKEGMPVTALREIKILKALTHPCIVELWDMFVVPSQGRDHPMSVYMVFPYMDHDLAGLLENERVHLSPSQIKLYMKQLLEGTEYMHHNHILHRDMKAANLLISNAGTLKIADFGLARSFDPSITTKKGKFGRNGHERRYTNCVVTRWYRPPELLLGAKQYGGEIDLWGIGCVLGEMFSRRPILTGNSDLDQLEKIFQLCGSPNQQNWPDFDMLPGCEGQIRFPAAYSRRIKIVYDSVGKETADLLDKLLTLDPRERITATQALDHAYFWTDPLPADPKSLPTYDSSHEYDQRGRRNQQQHNNNNNNPQHLIDSHAHSHSHRPALPPPLHNRGGGHHYPPHPPHQAYQQQPHQPSHLRNAPYGQPQPPPQPPPSSLPPPIHLQPNGSRNWPGQGHGPGPGPGPHPHFQRNGPGPGGPPLRDRDRERDRDRWVPQPQSQGPNDRPPSLPARPPVDLPARPSLPPPRGKGGGVMMGYPPPPPAPWDTRGDRDGAASSGGLNYG